MHFSLRLRFSNGRSPLCIDGRRQCLLEDDNSPQIQLVYLFITYRVNYDDRILEISTPYQILPKMHCNNIYITPTPDGGGRRVNSLNILNLIGFNVW